MDSVSVVIPVHNGAPTLGAQLDALATQDFESNYEVIVVDNGSTDTIGAVIARSSSRLPNVRLVEASERQGVCYARNVGARAATGDLILGCDADDVVLVGWISGIVKALARFDVVGGWFDEQSLNAPAIRTWHDPRPTDGLKRPYHWLSAFIGANYGFHRRVFEAIGGWNEAYVSAEDIEFSWRAQLAGFSLGFAPEAGVQYRYRPTLTGLARQEFFRARSAPRLLQEFRAHGYRPPPVSSRAAGSVRWLLENIPRAMINRGIRGRWVRKAVYSAGWALARARR